jgi:cell division protein FtsZ
MERARRVVFSVTGGPSMSLQHVNAVAQTISAVADPDANIIFGAAVDDDLGDELTVTVVATDFPGEL